MSPFHKTETWPGCRLGGALALAVFALMSAPAAVFLTPTEVAGALPDPAQRAAIEQAVPESASAVPRKPRRLLVFDRNVNYGGHPSAAHASYAFTIMGRKTGAFEAIVSRDPAVFEHESLRTFDAVFFNNNVGNLFEEPHLRRNLLEFILTGGGMLGVHGTSVAFTRWPGAQEDWPEFGLMLGARGANHRISTEHVFIQLDDPAHPLNRVFDGRDFEYRDEFFRVHEPYSRDRVRVLFRIDTARTDMNQGQGYGRIERADQDYALAWIRNYGRGRTFYCTIAHHPSVFSDPLMLGFYLDAIQFALGDLEAPTTPSARLTPAVRAQEELGWQLTATGTGTADLTLFDAIDRASALGFSTFSGSSDQPVSAGIPTPFGPALTAEERRQIRFKLDAAGLRLVTYGLRRLPADPVAARRRFEFAQVMGAETIILGAAPDTFDQVGAWCDQLDLRLAVHGSETPGPAHWRDLLDRCRSASPRLGIAADPGGWTRAAIDPAATLRLLGDRLFVVRLPAVPNTQASHPPPTPDMRPWLEAIRDHATGPVQFSLDLPASAAARADFDAMTLLLDR